MDSWKELAIVIEQDFEYLGNAVYGEPILRKWHT